MARKKVIIDTDPGIDDVLAMLLAFASPEELDVLLLSVTYGNIDIRNCLRNVVSLFHHIEKEWEWRRANGQAEGFESLKRSKPLVAVGAEEPLGDQLLMADYFHGIDGLGGIHGTHPHMTPEESWRDLFSETPNSPEAQEILTSKALFTPSKLPAHEEILRLLRENEPDTISLVVIGPMTNVAIAAAADTATFLRVKEVIVMGGAINEHGNAKPSSNAPPLVSLTPKYFPRPPPFHLVKQPTTPLRIALNRRNQITPVAEFNTYADTIAAARVFALTSPEPASTMPPVPPKPAAMVQEQGASPPPPYLASYKDMDKEPRRLKLTLFPLDVTHRHCITRGTFNSIISPLLSTNSTMAEWINAFLSSTFAKVESQSRDASGDSVKIDLHDPLTIWYLIDYAANPERWKFAAPDDDLEDIRVETAGQWTRGMMVLDRRTRKKRQAIPGEEDPKEGAAGDGGSWLVENWGNRVKRCVGSGSEKEFGEIMLKRILNLT